VADLLKGKWDGKYIYARTRNWCNRKVTVQIVERNGPATFKEAAPLRFLIC